MSTTTLAEHSQYSWIKTLRTAILGLGLTLGIVSNTVAESYQLDTVATDLDYPWSVDFLPDGDILVTELSGSLRRIAPNGSVSDPIENVPKVYRASQGGLFDVCLLYTSPSPRDGT